VLYSYGVLSRCVIIRLGICPGSFLDGFLSGDTVNVYASAFRVKISQILQHLQGKNRDIAVAVLGCIGLKHRPPVLSQTPSFLATCELFQPERPPLTLTEIRTVI